MGSNGAEGRAGGCKRINLKCDSCWQLGSVSGSRSLAELCPKDRAPPESSAAKIPLLPLEILADPGASLSIACRVLGGGAPWVVGDP